MSRQSVWKCDNCKKEETATHLPLGWLEVSFWQMRWHRYYFDSYACLVEWAEAREAYYGNRGAEDRVAKNNNLGSK